MNRSKCVVVLLAAALAGCATPNYKEGEATSGALRATAAEAASTQSSIDASLTALHDLMAMKEGDLRPKFEAFSGAVDRLADSVDAAQRRADTVTTKANSYLAQWEQELKQVKDDGLRARSSERKAEVEKRVKDVTELVATTRTQSQSVVEQLRDIRRVLSTDLTLGGVASVTASVPPAETSAASLRESAVKLNGDLEALSNDLSSVTPGWKPPEQNTATTQAGEPTK